MRILRNSLKSVLAKIYKSQYISIYFNPNPASDPS